MNTELVERGASIESLRNPMPVASAGTAMMKAEGDRAVAEVQAALVVAKRFPRDEQAAYNKIQKACRRHSLAEAALYAYNKGGSEVSGPSIRLAEELARSWGNIAFGWKILSQDDESSEVRAEAWDLETNVPAYITFTVRHEFKAHGKIKQVTDPREIYELIANQASRRLRACIMRVIPGDVQDMAVDQCEKTLKEGGGKPLSDRIRDMIAAFANDMAVTQAMIEKRVGKNAAAINETEFVNLRKIYGSLRDGMSKVEDWFDQAAGGGGATSTEDLKKTAASSASAGTAPSSAAQAQERAAAPAKAAEPEQKVVEQKTWRVVTERGRVLTEIAFEPKLGSQLEIEKLPYRVIEVTEKPLQVVVKATDVEKAPEHPKPGVAERDEDPMMSAEAVTAEIMGAETLDDLKEARGLIERVPEKDRSTLKVVADSKEKQLGGNKTKKRGGLD